MKALKWHMPQLRDCTQYESHATCRSLDFGDWQRPLVRFLVPVCVVVFMFVVVAWAIAQPVANGVELPPGPVNERVERYDSGDVALEIPGSWLKAPGYAADQRCWVVGDPDDPVASIAVLRDTSFSGLVEAIEQRQQSSIRLGSQNAIRYQGRLPERGNTILVVVETPRGDGKQVAVLATARNDRWNKMNAVLSAAIASVEIHDAVGVPDAINPANPVPVDPNPIPARDPPPPDPPPLVVPPPVATVSPYVGVNVRDVESPEARQLKVRSRWGAVFVRIYPNSPAALAGMKAGDVVYGCDGLRVQTRAELSTMIQAKKPGDRVVIDYLRGQQKLRTALILQRWPDDFVSPGLPAGSNSLLSAIGLEVLPLTEEVRRMYGQGGAAIVGIQANSMASATALRRGDMVMMCEDSEVTSPEQLVRLLNRAWNSGKHSVTLGITRPGANMSYRVTVSLPPRQN